MVTRSYNWGESTKYCGNKTAVSSRLLKMKALPLALALAIHNTAVIAELPVPSTDFIYAGQGIAVMQSDGVHMVINQQSDRAIMNWESFNVGSENSVTFNQPDSSSVALNRIFQSDPSRILGALNANGQVYLYNQNGIIFGEGAKVNVGSLVATTLNVDTDLFLQSAITNAIENGNAAFFDETLDNSGIIEIRPTAEINANDPNGGRILVIAPEIINAGTLNSPDGQTILAASSDKVYLAVSDRDPNLRGLLVEVETGGSVENVGSIVAERGNVSLVGLAVNQSGRIRATTSVDKNGSIRLLARDNAVVLNEDQVDASLLESIGIEGDLANKPTAAKLAVAQESGSVILGPGSVTEIVPDDNFSGNEPSTDDEVIRVPDAQEQLQSRVEIVGREIWLQKDASIVAPSGKVKITATDSPRNPMRNVDPNSSYVYMDEGSQIDVSGTDTTILPMARNSLEVQVRSNELADAPLQRDGILRGSTVYVDLREGTEILDYSGALENVEKTLSERLASGGEIDIRSEGDVVQLDGSLMDVSGGHVTYEAGFIRETQLISNNRVYSLSDADKNRSYDAILGVETKEHDRWGVSETFDDFAGISSGRYVGSFVEGKAAGNVSISAAATTLAANGLRAETTVGPYQREQSKLPSGGRLDVDLRAIVNSTQGVTFLAESVVDPVTEGIVVSPDPDSLLREAITSELVLPDSYMSKSGLSRLTINSNGMVVVNNDASITTRPGADMDLAGSGIIMNGAITSNAGNISLTAEPVLGATTADLVLGDDAVIDTSGLWINEGQALANPDMSTPRQLDAGDISLVAEGDVILGQGSLLNTSGGARLDAEYNVIAGKGGDIRLVAREQGGSSVKLGGELHSYALFEGGELEIQTASILVNDDPSVGALPDQVVITRRFFETGGFSKYRLVANAGDLVVDTGIRPLAQNLEFSGSGLLAVDRTASLSELVLQAPTGTLLDAITDIRVLPDHLRQAVDVELSLQQTLTESAYNLVLSDNAAIRLDAGASLELKSDTSIHVAGSIDAPGGDIELTITPPSFETGFLDNQGIWLAAGSSISARSDVILIPNAESLRTGTLFDAGNVTLNANRGYVLVQDGASVDVSADKVTFDMISAGVGGTGYQPVDIAPDAGRISITSAEGVYIDGDIQANAADVDGARGGAIDVSLNIRNRGISRADNDALSGDLEKFNFNSRDVIITQGVENVLSSLRPGDAIDAGLNGLAVISAEKIVHAGLDTLGVTTAHIITDQATSSSASEVRFDGHVDLAIRDSIRINSPTVNADGNNVSLEAAYIAVGDDGPARNSITTTPEAGVGKLVLQASLVDIIGDVDFTRTGSLAVNASEDIRFIGAPTFQQTDRLHGALNTTAAINFHARQLYPVTNSHFSVNLVDNTAGVITLSRLGNSTPVLSAGGSLSMNAPAIVHGGVVKAPLGTIVFNASDEIKLLDGSMTSISAEGLVIPYGETRNAGSSWNYNIDSAIISAELPDKTVELNAPDVDMQQGAVIDLSGNGDAVAWEFVPGPGGNSDVLLVDLANRVDNTDGAFAIIPGSGNQYAPYDRLLTNDNFSFGDRIYFDGGNGVEAGFYTMLPARYALLPGAKLVTPLSGISNIYPDKTITRADGVEIVAGKYSTANTDIIDSSWSAFAVEDGAVARTRSEYIETFATDFFSSNRPVDAGALVIDTLNNLTLAGVIKGVHEEGARGSRLDIFADNIEVVSQAGDISSGFVQLTDDSLNALSVDTMLLGGKRRIGEDRTTVAIRASEVVIRENAVIETPELLLVANDRISVESGATLTAKGGTPSGLGENMELDNNAAILGVSVNPLSRLTRNGTSTGASIDLAPGSVLAATNSIMIDSSGNVALDASINVPNGNIRLGADQVNLGNPPASTAGLNLTADALAALDVNLLQIRSDKDLAVYDNVDLSLNNLELVTSGINNVSADGNQVALKADGTIVLRHNGESALVSAPGEGALNLSASHIVLDARERDFVVDGFSNVALKAAGSVRTDGEGTFDFGGADVTIDTPLVTGSIGSGLAVRTSGDADLVNTTASTVDPATITLLGSQLEFAANSIYVDTGLVFPSGRIALGSTGLTTDDHVELGPNARLDVSGRTISYVDGSLAGSSGGRVELSSIGANVQMLEGSRIDLASSAVAGDAGTLTISAANGTVMLDSTISTSGASGFAGAGLCVDTGQLTDAAAFIQAVQAAGFSRSQQYRLRNGDLDLAALPDGTVNITAGEIGLAVDSGYVTITGKLDASGDKAGMVDINAAGDLVLAGAGIDASAYNDNKGGKVVLASTAGSISADAATEINVAAAGADGGTVALRAQRTDSNTDIAVSQFDANVSGAERIDIEGVTVYNDSIVDAGAQAVYRDDAADWLSNAATITTRLGLGADARVNLLPGVEIVNDGSITVSDTVDFYQWQIDTAGVVDQGTFTLRATDNLTLNASVSDGVLDALIDDTDPVPVPMARPGDAWSYRLISGADTSSADRMAVNTDTDPDTGNLKLADGVVVRTSTGDIEIAVGGSLELADQTSAIYTTGTPNTGLYDDLLLHYIILPQSPLFADGGGDITINVAADINAAVSDQYFTDWLQRAGGSIDGLGNIEGMWGVVLNDFEQGIATFGGGDIAIHAGGSISDLSVSTPRSGQIDTDNNVIVRGGGDIVLYAGGGIYSARLLVDGGDGVIRSQGDITASDGGLETLISMGDASLRIEAGGDIGIEGIGNMTMLPMSDLQSGVLVFDDGFGGTFEVPLFDIADATSYFFTYSDSAGVELVSQYGDIHFNNDITAIQSAPGNLVDDTSNPFLAWSIFPGSLEAASLTGDINIINSFTLYPDADGSLGMLAGRDITSRDAGNNTQINVLMSDVAISDLPDVSEPDNAITNTVQRLIGDVSDQSNRHDINAPVHINDPDPVFFVANRNIVIKDPLKLLLPKKARIHAGSDIVDLGVDIQNLLLSDKSIIVAGGDIIYTIPEAGNSFVNTGIRVTGPGRADIIAGGDVDLGISKGIRSDGNIDNFVLPEQGADISVFAGVDNIDTGAFIATYFEGDRSGDAALIDIDVPAYQRQLIDYVQSDGYNGDIIELITAVTGKDYINRADAIAAFNSLSPVQQLDIALASFRDSHPSEQRGLLLSVLFNEINTAAFQQASTGNEEEYARGFLAINRLFGSIDDTKTALLPALVTGTPGDIELPFSRIVSRAGGDINLLAPKGELTVGFTAAVANRSPNEGALGVIVSSKGDLSALTDGNINVNLARMLTLDGGDISLWSSTGDIDAGRGAKTELTIPPPLTVFDRKTGQIKIIFPPAVSGSGIGAASFSPDTSPGKVTLAAPGGVINASDAGIRSEGDLVLAATQVLGNDISAGGVSVGVPVATNVTAGLTGLSSTTDSAIQSATKSVASTSADTSTTNEGVALVTVEHIGYGEEEDE